MTSHFRSINIVGETVTATTDEPRRISIAASVVLALGFIIGAWILGAEIRGVRMADRYVAVRGLAERTVKADLAIWPLPFREAGNDLKATFARSEQDRQAVLDFLAQQGIPKAEISLGQPSVIDTQANQFGTPNRPNRFIVEQRIWVRSKNVDQVAAAVQKTSELIARGVVLGADPSYGPGSGAVSYLFTGLNAIKPEMITEATRNARVVAERFAADSKSKVGGIRLASQGLFTITSADSTSSSGYAGSQSNSGIMKKVRVVTTIDYYLEK
ncbi:MAG: SIMPL domain-containing protein [Terriglobia bacterium]